MEVRELMNRSSSLHAAAVAKVEQQFSLIGPALNVHASRDIEAQLCEGTGSGGQNVGKRCIEAPQNLLFTQNRIERRNTRRSALRTSGPNSLVGAFEMNNALRHPIVLLFSVANNALELHVLLLALYITRKFVLQTVTICFEMCQRPVRPRRGGIEIWAGLARCCLLVEFLRLTLAIEDDGVDIANVVHPKHQPLLIGDPCVDELRF